MFSDLTALWELHVYGNNNLSSLPAGVFSDLTALRTINLGVNKLTSLPPGVFSGLSSLGRLWLGSREPPFIPVTVSLEKVGEDQFKATVHTGAPFEIVLPLSVANGSISSGTSTITIPIGSVESETLTVARTPGTTFAVTVDIGTLPELPEGEHLGYALVKSADLPLVLTEFGGTVLTPVCDRTPQVLNAIVAAVSGVSNCRNVTEAHLAAITEFDLTYKDITSLKVGDFSGLSSVTLLQLHNNRLSSLPAGVFAGLSALKTIRMHNNQLTTLPDGAFFGLTSLTRLELYQNQLRTLTAEGFSGLPVLEELELNSNQLTELPDGVFSKLPTLTSLRLVSNQLSVLSPGAFSGLPALKTLHLYRNQLSTLPVDVFSGLTTLEDLNLQVNQLTELPNGIFDGLTALKRLDLNFNQLSTLPDGVFSELTSLTTLNLVSNQLRTLPDGIFSRLTSLTQLTLGRNPVEPLPLPVSLEKVADGQFKAVAPTGAPFDMVLPLSVTNGTIDGGATTITIPAGSIESTPFTVTRTPGTTFAVTVDIGDLPGLPNGHSGYALVKSADLPLAIIDPLAGGITPVCDRTPQVQTAILGVLQLQNPSPSTCGEITEAHLATGITSLFLNGQGITALQAGDFDGLTSLEELLLYSNQLTTLPDGIFDGLSSLTTLRFGLNQLTTLPDGIFEGLTALTDLRMVGNQFTMLPEGIFEGLTALTTLRLGGNAVDPLPLTISLEKVGEGQFKAVAPTGAPFDIVLPLTVANGTISGGATIITIPAGRGDSESLTVTRTPGSTFAVTVDIGTLPGLPSDHSGYALVKSADLPLAIIDPLAGAPTPVCDRTPQVRDEIVRVVQGVSTCGDVTEAHLASIEGLYPQKKMITALKTEDFDGLSSLTELSLRGNQLSSLAEDVFSGLSALTRLDLDDNQLSSLPEDVFSGLSSLSLLNLYDNQLSSLPAGLFSGLSSLSSLGLADNQLSSLPAGVFSGLSSLTSLWLFDNQLSSLPEDVFSGLSSLELLGLQNNQLSSLPARVFSGLSSLELLRLQGNSSLLPLTVSLERVGETQFKATVHTGAPFTIVLPLSVSNGSIDGGATTITIPIGSVESEPLTVSRTPSTIFAVTVDIGTLPGLPTNQDSDGRFHQGYALAKSADLPLAFPELGGAVFTSVCDRTPQVRDVLVAAVPGVSNCRNVTEAHLAAITILDLQRKGITALKAGDFDGLNSLIRLWLRYNELSTLPVGIFDGLTELRTLYLSYNALTSLPAGIFDGLTELRTLYLSYMR